MSEAMIKINDLIENYVGITNLVVTLNAEMVMLAREDSEFNKIINKAELVVGDGSGIVWASKFIGSPLQERVTGIDLLTELLSNQDKGYKFFFYGGAPGVVETAAEKMKEKYPYLSVVGVQHGYIESSAKDELIKQINILKPDILCVALGAPKQEKWIWENRDRLGAKVAIGVGGSFDVLSGNKDRSPEYLKNNGLEWLYRVYKEPKRVKRIMKLPKFVVFVIINFMINKPENNY